MIKGTNRILEIVIKLGSLFLKLRVSIGTCFLAAKAGLIFTMAYYEHKLIHMFKQSSYILNKVLVAALSFFSFLLLAQETPLESQLPTSKAFWQLDAKLYKKIEEEKEIVVLAKTTEKTIENLSEKSATSLADKAGPKKTASKIVQHLNLQSAGHIQSSLDFTYNKILAFEEYPNMSSAFDRVSFDKQKSILSIRVGAFDYYAHLKIRMRFEEKNKQRLIHWLCIDGPFAGMKGTILLEEFKRRVTEISMFANYEAERLPLPRVLLGFGMEVAGRQIAASMRNFVEKDFKKQ